jgi:hypothetical protein
MGEARLRLRILRCKLMDELHEWVKDSAFGYGREANAVFISVHFTYHVKM